jgi:CMP-N-acetylneuraminic acid synthetase
VAASLFGHLGIVRREQRVVDPRQPVNDVRRGLAVPFTRPPELASDSAVAVDVWRHAWHAAERVRGTRFALSILLEPSSPLRRPEDVEAALCALVNSGREAAVTVSRTPAHYTPERALRIREDGSLQFYSAEGGRHTARQSIPAYYHRNGLAYAVTREGIFQHDALIGDHAVAVVVEREVVNIDTELELAWAEFLLAREESALRPSARQAAS